MKLGGKLANRDFCLEVTYGREKFVGSLDDDVVVAFAMSRFEVAAMRESGANRAHRA